MTEHPETPPLILPVDTAHVTIEGKQYELFGFDLGEGVYRRVIAVGAIVFAGWALLMVILGVPLLAKTGIAFYTVVPSLVTFMALRKDRMDRPMYAMWWDWVRFQPRRFRRVVPRPTGSVPQPRIQVRPEMNVIDTTHPMKRGHK